MPSRQPCVVSAAPCGWALASQLCPRAASAGYDFNLTSGRRHEPAEVTGVARHDAVADGGNRGDRGVGCLAAPSTTQQHARAATEPVINRADIDGFQEPREVALATARIAPHLGHHDPRRAELETQRVRDAKASDHRAVIAINSDEGPSIEDQRAHATGATLGGGSRRSSAAAAAS